jgi:hypothetical protein
MLIAPFVSHFARTRANARSVQDLDQRHTGPFRRADSAVRPSFAFDWRIEQRPAVAGALQRGHQRLRTHVVKVAEAQVQGPIDQAANRQSERLRVQVGNVEVISDDTSTLPAIWNGCMNARRPTSSSASTMR